ncbi:hypothetical protein LCGC14_1416830 [marine sediment metagenome]|uniref:HNH nuclease domain-containing protein n=1 Tax=marine sediment metagenome TaxID=412755 RepID=A0A0F9KDU9_9ZZZZ
MDRLFWSTQFPRCGGGITEITSGREETKKTIMKKHPYFSSYSVTRSGRVWSHKRACTRGGWIASFPQKSGHLSTTLFESGKSYCCYVHRLVLETFIGSCPNGMECRHLNNNPSDNRLENLKWGTRSENSRDSLRHGTHSGLGKYGEKSSQSKLSDQDRQLIFNIYYNEIYTQRELADRFGVGQTTISRTINR